MYNNDSNSLNAGAPDIRLSGNQQMASMEPSQEGTLEDIYYELIGMGFSPEEAAKRAREFYDEMSKAPKQNLGIMAAAPAGTYTQQRKQMMAYGGVAGADGRKKYGLGSFLQDIKDKIVDDIIPNEIKENPLATAALIGGGINQFGLPDFLTGGTDVGQNWLGDLLGNINPNLSDMVLGPGGSEYSTTRPSGIDSMIYGMEQPTTYTDRIMDIAMNRNQGVPYMDRIMDIAQNRTPVEAVKKSLYDRFTDTMGNVFSDTTRADGTTFNYKIPVAAGLAAGAYTASQPRDTLPMDTTGINFQTAQQAMDDPNLRFKPKLEDTQLAASGGRIGYAGGGGGFESYKDYLEQIPNNDKILELYAAGDMAAVIKELKRRGIDTDDQYAQGGRIGYQDAGDVDPEYNGWKKIYETNPGLAEMHDNHPKYLERYKSETPKMAEGGLMNLGGMEKDYRNEGGFVALGGKEKADDVPARLSKNEFVFTADAVRGAGGGDIDKGAAIMEDLMNNLEGARGMFANAQKLEKRII